MPQLRDRLSTALTNGTKPPEEYVGTLGPWLDFLNLDVDTYLATADFSRVSEDGDDDGPVMVDLAKLEATLKEHTDKRQELLDQLPSSPINAGLWLIDVTEVA